MRLSLKLLHKWVFSYLRDTNTPTVSPIPPWHQALLPRHRALRCPLIRDVVDKREPFVWRFTFQAACLQNAGAESSNGYLLGPGHRSIVDETSGFVNGFVEVVDGCLHVHSTVVVKGVVFEHRWPALNVWCVQAKGNATAVHDENWKV